jgi:hypothetical protein
MKAEEIINRLNHRHNRRREVIMFLGSDFDKLAIFMKRIIESDDKYSLLNTKKI